MKESFDVEKNRSKDISKNEKLLIDSGVIDLFENKIKSQKTLNGGDLEIKRTHDFSSVIFNWNFKSTRCVFNKGEDCIINTCKTVIAKIKEEGLFIGYLGRHSLENFEKVESGNLEELTNRAIKLAERNSF